MTLEQRIFDEIETRMNQSTGRLCDGITITMKTDGNELRLVPCFDNPADEPESMSKLVLASADYLLVIGSGVAVNMGGKPHKVCHQLATYDELLKKREEDIKKLEDYCHNHQDDDCFGSDSFEFYSDWHKDVFGFRPRGWTVGVPRQ